MSEDKIWYIAVSGYGVVKKICTEAEAEEFRRDKANQEGAPAIKIAETDLNSLNMDTVLKHWGYKMIFKRMCGV